MGCKTCYKAWCTLVCEDIKTLGDGPSPPRYPRPGRRTGTRARIPQVVVTRPSVADLRLAPHSGLSHPRPASPNLRPASLFAGRDEVELRPVVGSLPSPSSSSVSSLATAIEDSNTIVDNPSVASFRRWSWPLTSPDEDTVSWVCRLRERRLLMRRNRPASWFLATKQALRRKTSDSAI